MSFSSLTRELSSVRETAFGVTPAAPTMKEVRALKTFTFKVVPGTIESAEKKAHRQKVDVRLGNKKGDFSIPFQLSYGDFDELFEEVMGGTWTPAASVTAAITVAAAGKTFARPSGSFVTAGFEAGQQIVTSGFTTPANNGTFIVSGVTALAITCATATGLVDETGTANTVTTTMDVLTVGNIARSRTFEERNPDANLYEANNGCVISGFDLDVSPEKIVTGTFKGFIRDCVLASKTNAAIAVASGGKTFTCSDGGFLMKGSPFIVGMNVITSGFTNAANNGTFAISAVSDTVVTCSTATGLVTEAAGSGKSIVMGSLGTPVAASEVSPYDSYTGEIVEGGNNQGEVTGVKLSFDNQMKANYTILTPGADAAASIKPGDDIKNTGEVDLYFEDQTFKQKFLAGQTSTLSFTLGSGIPGEKSMRFVQDRIRYTGVERSTDSVIIEKAPYEAIYNTPTATSIAIYRIP